MLEKIKKQIEAYVASVGYGHVSELYGKIAHGKMLRSKLILAIVQDRVNPEKVIRLCAVIEMIHLASLLHDDVIDDATTRRGIPSINAAFGNKAAIMMGDILYSKAFHELTFMDAKIAQTVSNAVTLLSVGEMMDVQMAESFNTIESQYLDMIYLKTASLIEASAYAAAVMAEKNAEAYKVYGKNLGVAFQMIDDLLDITSDSETLGKPALNDLREGKTTLPYIRLYHRMSEADQERLRGLHREETGVEQVAWIKEQMQKHQTIEECHVIAKEWGQNGIDAIADDSNEKLQSIMQSMIEREF